MNIAKAILTLLAGLPFACLAAGSQTLLDQLEADHAVLLAAQRDFQQQQERGALSARAAADYAAYLEGLRGRVAADCLALAEVGSERAAAPPCAAFSPGPARALPLEEGVPLNHAERTGVLDDALEASLSEFDELLLREQRRIRAAAPRSAAGAVAAAEGGAPGSEQTDSAGDGSQAQAGGSGGSEHAGGAPQPGQQAGGRPPGAGAGGEIAAQRGGAAGPPPGIPDGSDDDVVARQLREAAEQETDPELQKKLWEEYRRYKQGIR